MAGMRFTFEAYGEQLVSREMLRFGERVTDARPAFSQIADDLMAAETNRFRTSGNGTWPALAASTIKAKGHSRILDLTGDLKKSLTVRGAPHQELIIQPRFLVFGTTLAYAEIHAKGGKRGGVAGFPPVRKPLGFTETVKRDSIRTLQRFVVTGQVR